MKIFHFVLLLNIFLVSCAGGTIPGLFNTPPVNVCSNRSQLIIEDNLKNITINEDYSKCKSLAKFECGSDRGIQNEEMAKMKSFAFNKKC